MQSDALALCLAALADTSNIPARGAGRLLVRRTPGDARPKVMTTGKAAARQRDVTPGQYAIC